jgi:hypothetical protein
MPLMSPGVTDAMDSITFLSTVKISYRVLAVQVTHTVKECQASALKCVNCLNLKTKDEILEILTDHAVWDMAKCDTYKQALNKLKLELFGSSI